MKKIGKRVVAVLLAVFTVVAVSACGKKAAFDPSKRISVVTREDGSGTKSAFMELLGLKGKSDVSGAIVMTGTAAVLAEVRSNPLALAFESLGYVTDDVKMLKVNGVEATVENIRNGSYKIARPLGIVYTQSSSENALNAAYLKFLQSSAAQTIIRDNGYVALADHAPDYTTDASLSGSLTLSGSTSLQPLMIELAKKFQNLQPNVQVNISGGGSGTGYKDAANGVSDFGMISETFQESKAPGCLYYEVAKDGIAMIVNKSNPQDDITLEALKNIYNADAGEDAITVWKDAQN